MRVVVDERGGVLARPILIATGRRRLLMRRYTIHRYVPDGNGDPTVTAHAP